VCGRGGDILELEEALVGGDFPTRKADVFRLVGRIDPEYSRDGARTKRNPAGTAPSKPTKPIGAADGWHETARYLKPDGEKVFRQCRPDGRAGVIWNLDGIQRVPYRLPKVLNAKTVYLPEGEKDVHTLEMWGVVDAIREGPAAAICTRSGQTISEADTSSSFPTMTSRAGSTRRPLRRR
jgi:hypothetical protein